MTLVGSGPGDPGLLTIKGREALEAADVVVFDRLISPCVLALIPERAERINVGKQAHHHPVPQEQINQILLYFFASHHHRARPRRQTARD